MSANFSSFFAIGKRITFSCSYVGKPIVEFDSDHFTFDSDWEIGCSLTELVPQLEKAFKEITENDAISFSESVTFQTLFSSYDMCEYPSVEIYSLLALFSMRLNQAK